MAADILGADAGNPFPICHPVALVCSSLAPYLSTWPVVAAHPIPLYLLPTVGLCGVVPQAAGTVYPAPLVWVASCLAHGSGLQWPTPLGAEATVSSPHGVLTHLGQPSTPHSSHSKASGSLCGLPMGAPYSLAWLPTYPAAQLPSPPNRVWDIILAVKLPLDNPLQVAPVYWQ